MKLELKAIKYAAFASQETACYEAKLYADGKRVADVSNDGRGGPDYQHNTTPAYADVVAYIATLPGKECPDFPRNPDGSVWVHKPSVESVCADLLDDYLQAKDLKRLLRSRILFREGKSLREVNRMKPTLENIAKIQQQKPEWELLNTMTFAQALEVFRCDS